MIINFNVDQNHVYVSPTSILPTPILIPQAFWKEKKHIQKKQPMSKRKPQKGIPSYHQDLLIPLELYSIRLHIQVPQVAEKKQAT